MAGVGIISPIGIEKEEFYKKLLGREKNFNKEGDIYQGHGKDLFSSRVSNSDKEKIKRAIKNSEKYSMVEQFAIYASVKALMDACISIESLRKSRVLIIMGSGDSQSDSFDCAMEKNKIYHTISSDRIAEVLSEYLDINAEAFCVHTACASSLTAIDLALKYMKDGQYDIGIVGGVDCFSKLNYAGFSTIRAISKMGCTPFAVNRDGITIGEGAGVLVLQNVDKIKNPYCEIIGAGTSCDAYHLVRCNQEGPIRAIEQMIKNYHINVDDIELVISHGTGTQLNDVNESAVINATYSSNVMVCSVKGTIGHLMGASGGVAAVLAAMIYKYHSIPAESSENLVDPKCNVNLIVAPKEIFNLKITVCHAFGFGGNNAVVAFKGI